MPYDVKAACERAFRTHLDNCNEIRRAYEAGLRDGAECEREACLAIVTGKAVLPGLAQTFTGDKLDDCAAAIRARAK